MRIGRISQIGLMILLLGCSRERPAEEPAQVETPVAGEPAAVSGGTGWSGRSTLGAHFRSLSLADREKLDPPPAGGIVIAEILSRGPAKRARLAAGDVVVAMNGAPVGVLCDFYSRLAERPPGEAVRLSIQRRNATFEATVTPASAADLYEPACEAGEAAGCLLLGWEKPPEEALPLFHKACEIGLADGCALEGNAYLNGKGAAQDEQRSAALFERSCLLGSAPGCVSEAYQYVTGRGVQRDVDRALDLYTRSCDAGDASGCYNVGVMLDMARGVERDPARAIRAYEQSCDGGYPLACTNLGYLAQHGKDMPQDEARAADLYRRACEPDKCNDPDSRGCANLAILYRRAIGVTEDKSRAADLFQRACDGGQPDACFYLGEMLDAGEGIEKDPTRAAELYRQACKGGHQPGCEAAERLGK
jgi:TPR repeat protein